MNIIYDRVEVVFRASGSVFDCRQICETITDHKEFYARHDEVFKEIIVGTRSGTAEDAKRVFYNTIDTLTKEGKKLFYYG